MYSEVNISRVDIVLSSAELFLTIIALLRFTLEERILFVSPLSVCCVNSGCWFEHRLELATTRLDSSTAELNPERTDVDMQITNFFLLVCFFTVYRE